MATPCSETQLSAAWESQRNTQRWGALPGSGSRCPLPPISLLTLCAPFKPLDLTVPDLCSVRPFTCKCWLLPPASPVPPGQSCFRRTPQPVDRCPLPSQPPCETQLIDVETNLKPHCSHLDVSLLSRSHGAAGIVCLVFHHHFLRLLPNPCNNNSLGARFPIIQTGRSHSGLRSIQGM